MDVVWVVGNGFLHPSPLGRVLTHPSAILI